MNKESILFVEMCKKVAQQTDNNDHTGAKITVAKFFKFGHFIKVFEAVKQIQDEEVFLDGSIADYRCRKGKELINHIEQEHGKEIRDIVYKSF